MTWMSSSAGGSPNERPGLFHAQALHRFRLRLASRLQGYSGTGDGGVDICCIGDSNTFGYNASTRRFDNWTHLLKVDLQQRFNPSGIQGGYGFAMASRGSLTASQIPGTVVNGTWTDFPGSEDASADTTNGNLIDLQGGIGGVRLAIDGSSNAREFRTAIPMNGTLSARHRTQITDCELVYCTRSNGATDGGWDISTGSAPGTGAGNVLSATINGNGTNDHHVRSALVSGLTPSAQHFLQVSGGSSAAAWFYVNGINLYNGDTSCGVRLHNFGQPSRRIYDISADALRLAATVDQWATGTGPGARYAGLFIVMSGLNEAGSGATGWGRTATDYYNDLLTLIARIRNNTSTLPSILLVGQPPRAGAANAYITGPDTAIYGRTANAPEEYRQAELAAATANQDICTYLNVPEALGWVGAYGATTFESVFRATSAGLALGSPDGLHLTTRGHRVLADLIYDVLTIR